MDNSKPLVGKRVVVTRAPEQAGELLRELERLGAEVLLLPMVAFADPIDSAPLDASLRSLGRFDWVLFTSPNAVAFFAQRARTLGLDCRALQSPRPMVAAVGRATAQAAEAEGFRVDHVAIQSSGEGLARDLWGSVTGRRILLPRSDRAGRDLPNALAEAGAEVVEVVAYRTVAPPAESGVLERIRRGEVDVVAFASPSALHHLTEELPGEALQELAGRILLAAIGPTTAAAIRTAGLKVAIETEESTATGLAAAIARHFVQQLSPGARTR